MTRMLAALLVTLAALFAGGPVLAQQQAPVEKSAVEEIIHTELSPETKQLADKLVQVTGSARVFDSVLPNIADQAKNGFIRSNPQMQLGIIAIVDRVAVELVSRRPELDDYLARVWASGFTDDEMRDLIAFYSTDTGKKFATTFTKVLAVEAAAADIWGQSIAAEMDQRVKDELSKAVAKEQEALQPSTDAPKQ